MLVPVELYAPRHVLIGTVETGRVRFSDHLNDRTLEQLILGEAWLGDPARPGAEPRRLAAANVRKRDVLLAAPLDIPGPAVSRPAYVATAGTPIAVSIGPYEVTGALQLPAGARFEIKRLFGPESGSFVPLSGATVSHAAGAGALARYPTILVRADRVAFAGPLAEDGAEQPFLRTALQYRLRALAGTRDG